MSDGFDYDGLAARITKALRGGGSRDDDFDDDDEPRGRRVPYDRFRRVNEENRQLREALEGLGGELNSLKEAQAQQFKELQEQAAQQVSAVRLQHDQDLELVEAGLSDKLGRQVLRQAWESAPKGQRGASPVDFWKQTIEAHKAHHADPENVAAPSVARPLTPYLPVIESPPDAGKGGSVNKQQLGSRGGPPPQGPGKRQPADISAVSTDSVEGFLSGLRALER
jgi:hypothetical protein